VIDYVHLLYCDWHLSHACHDRYLTWHITLLCTIHITVYLFYLCYLLYSTLYSGIVVLCTHYMHVHLPTHSLGVSDSLDLHIQVYVCYIAGQVFGEDLTPYEEPEFSWSSFLSIFLLSFIPIIFMILCIGLSGCSIFLFLWYHCVRNLYVILQWYWFFIAII